MCILDWIEQTDRFSSLENKPKWLLKELRQMLILRVLFCPESSISVAMI